MDWELFVWACGLAFGGMFAGALAGAAWMQRLARQNAEHMIHHDYRISNLCKARLIAGLRHCPVEWVVEEMHAERLERAAQRQGARDE